MKRASISLLSHLIRQKPNSLTPLLTRNYISDLTPSSSSSSSLLSSPNFPKSNGLIITPRQFPNTQYRNNNTLVQVPPQLNSRQRKIKERLELEEAFESADTAEEMLQAFKEMESVFVEKELGLASLKIGLKLDQEGEDPDQALSFASRALNALDRDDGKPSLPVAMALQLMGSVNYSLKRFNDSLGYLNRANRVLGKLEEGGVINVKDIRPVLHAVQLELANVKTAMGRGEEAVWNFKKCLEINVLTLEEDSKELGVAYRESADVYVAALNFKEAFPYAMKALEIHKNGLGANSVEVAHDRKLLGVIYSGLEEHEKALEQNKLSQKILKNWGFSSDLLHAEIEASNMQIALGRYEEAINTLRGVVQQTEKDSET